MASENETIGDIVDDLRNKACLSWICRRLKRDKELRTLADRIEAAHKREVDELKWQFRVAFVSPRLGVD